MDLTKHILRVQRELNIPDYAMCDILNVSETTFRGYKSGHYKTLNTYQKIMLVIVTSRPIEEYDTMSDFHKQLWLAVDKMAAKKGLSLTQLAISAGVSPSALCKSHRVKKTSGAEHFPSMETINKLMNVTNTEIDELVKMMVLAEE